jgi:hypothetical protein
MDDLRDRFATLDRVLVPDVWIDVERRLEALGAAVPTGRVAVEPGRRRGMTGAPARSGNVRGGPRNVGLLAAATLVALLLLGGAIAIGSGVVRLSQIVPPTPNTTMNNSLITSPPSTAPSVSPSPTAGLTRSGIGSGSWSITGLPRHGGCCGTATLLPDGRVLLAEGVSGEAELYDPAAGHWTETGRMRVARSGHIASLLADGRVLVAGGIDSPKGYLGPLASAELYDPISGTWTETGSMTRWRYYSEAISLADGRVLVVGGHVGDHVSSKRIPPGGGEETNSAETYDPATGTRHPRRGLVRAVRPANWAMDHHPQRHAAALLASSNAPAEWRSVGGGSVRTRARKRMSVPTGYRPGRAVQPPHRQLDPDRASTRRVDGSSPGRRNSPRVRRRRGGGPV